MIYGRTTVSTPPRFQIGDVIRLRGSTERLHVLAINPKGDVLVKSFMWPTREPFAINPNSQELYEQVAHETA